MGYSLKQRAQNTAEKESKKKKKEIRFKPYECLMCEERVSTIYNGLCSNCEMNRRKEEADKKF